MAAFIVLQCQVKENANLRSYTPKYFAMTRSYSPVACVVTAPGQTLRATQGHTLVRKVLISFSLPVAPNQITGFLKSLQACARGASL